MNEQFSQLPIQPVCCHCLCRDRWNRWIPVLGNLRRVERSNSMLRFVFCWLLGVPKQVSIRTHYLRFNCVPTGETYPRLWIESSWQFISRFGSLFSCFGEFTAKALDRKPKMVSPLLKFPGVG